jgi:transcriptional regulator with XRE-family HTH domain
MAAIPIAHAWTLMASELGKLIRDTREASGKKLRAFAREIGKSPAFITQLECDEEAPAVSEETLLTIANCLGIQPDVLLVLARRVPKAVVPDSELELTLYRRIKSSSEAEKRDLLARFNTKAAE